MRENPVVRTEFQCPKDGELMKYEQPYIAEQWYKREIWAQYYCGACGSRVLYESEWPTHVEAQ